MRHLIYAFAEKKITQMCERLLNAMASEYQHVEAALIYPGKAGELRMLREIQYLALQPHTEQLL